MDGHKERFLISNAVATNSVYKQINLLSSEDDNIYFHLSRLVSKEKATLTLVQWSVSFALSSILLYKSQWNPQIGG